MDLGYLVEILDLLLEKHMGIQLIAPRISDPPNETIAALDLLSTVFKRCKQPSITFISICCYSNKVYYFFHRT